MVAIGIVTLPEAGHVNPTRRLRNELLELDYDVRYIVRSGQEAFFREQGLPFVCPHMLPSGVVVIEGFSPEVVMVEAVLTHDAITAWAHHVTTMKLSATFSQRYDPRLPPLTCDLAPSASDVGAARVAAAWRAEQSRRASAPWTRQCVDLARERGFPVEWIDERAAIEVTFRFPELNLAPAELDFPREDPDLVHAGPCVDLARDERDRARLDDLPADKPIVYCAFGTQFHRYPALLPRLRVVLGAALLLPHLRFVLSWDGEDLGQLPPNLIALRRAPQLALLRRSALMINHGGLNSIKEALCLDVPPLVLPFDLDQPGNAARVAYHGCGLAASWHSLTATELARLVEGALSDEALKARVIALGQRLRRSLDDRQAARAFHRCWAISERQRRPPADAQGSVAL